MYFFAQTPYLNIHFIFSHSVDSFDGTSEDTMDLSNFLAIFIVNVPTTNLVVGLDNDLF